MMMQVLISSFILLLWHQTTWAQTLDVETCIGPLAAATACNSYQSILSECNSFTGKQAASCYCPQTVLNAIAGCQSEFRICVEGYGYDSEFEGVNGLFGLWHSACDGVLTYVPTTPAITSLSLTFDQANCLSAESYCQNFGASTDACTVSSANELQSCLCQATVLDLVSRCQIDGSISCLFQPPTTTNLFSYKQCGRSTGSTVVSPSIKSTRTAVTSQVSISTSIAQPSSTTSLPTNTASSSAQRTFRYLQFPLRMAGLIAVYFALS